MSEPLDEPLAGGTAGASVVVEPLVAGHVDFPRQMMVSPGGPLLTLKLLAALLRGKPPHVVPVPALSVNVPASFGVNS